jgi:hypothetical protein
MLLALMMYETPELHRIVYLFFINHQDREEAPAELKTINYWKNSVVLDWVRSRRTDFLI